MAGNRNLTVPNPQFESAGNRARQAASGGSGVGQVQGRFSIDTSGTDIAAGFGALAVAAQQISFERDAVKAVDVETKGAVKGQQDFDALDPLAPDYHDRVKAIAADVKRVALESSGITNSAVKDDLSKRMDRYGAALELNGLRMRKVAVSDEAIRVTKQGIDATNAKIRNDPGNIALYAAEFAADLTRLSVGMDPTKVPGITAVAADNFAKNQITGFAEKGNLGAARQALKAQAGNLTDTDVRGLSTYIDGRESKFRADGARASAQVSAKMLVEMSDMELSGNIDPNYRTKIEDANKSGLWANNPSGYVAVVGQYNGMVKRVRIEEGKNHEAIQAYNTGTIKNQEQADRAARVQLGGDLAFGQVATVGSYEQRRAAIEVGVDMASKTGFLPGDAKTLLNNADSITDPSKSKTIAFAAEMADELEAKAPQNIEGVNLRETGVVNIVRAEAKRLIKQGVAPEAAYLEAAQTHMGTDRGTQQEQADLKKLANDLFSKQRMDGLSLARDALSDTLQTYLPLFAGSPDIEPQMGATYKRLYTEAYVQTKGNEKLAKAVADKRISEVYGQTLVGTTGQKPMVPDADGNLIPQGGSKGNPYVTRYPAENFLPRAADIMTPEQKARAIDDDYRHILEEAGVSPNPSKDLIGKMPTTRLYADDTMVANLQAGRKAGWVVQVLNGSTYEPVGTSKGPLRYYPMTPEQLQKNSVFIEARTARLAEDKKAQEKNLILDAVTEDPVADEKLKRMREEGKRLKGGGR